MRLLMRSVKFWLPCVFGLALGSAAGAQVYESRDAQGNTVFSDRPSPGAEVVKVPPTNSADPVAETPERVQPPETPNPLKRGTGSAATPDQQAGDDYDPAYYGGVPVNNEEAQRRREEAKERREEGAGKPDRDPPARIEPRPAAPRPVSGGGRR
jgi:hypothetical protein